MPGRAALRLDPPVPPDLRRRDRHHLQEHDRVAGRIFPVPAITSADRSPAASGLPFRNGDTRSASRTATISPPAARNLPVLRECC